MAGKRGVRRWRVPLGTLTAVLFFVFARPDLRWLAVGAAPLLGGLALRVWAAGHIRKNRELAVGGPFRFTRNPLYLGSFFMAIGLGLQSGLPWLPLCAVPLFLAVYLPVMKLEGQDLQGLFPERYPPYRQAVPLFFPVPGRGLGASGRYSLSRAWRNREYNAVLGVLATEGVLLAKALCPSLNVFR